MTRKILTCILLCLAAACSHPDKHLSSKTVRIAMGNATGTLNPHRARGQEEFAIINMLYEGLMRINGSNQPDLGLAKSYKVSNDGTRYEFKLRQSQWSNGDPVFADHFVLSWRKALATDYPAYYASIMFVLKNAEKIHAGELPQTELGVHAPDPYTLVIDLEQTTPHILTVLSHTVFFPVHPDQEHGVSNGPFRLREWDYEDHITVEKNPAYRASANVQIDTIEMLTVSNETGLHMFEKGEIDWLGLPFRAITAEMIPELTSKGLLKRSPTLATAWIGINVENPPFDNLHIRRALAASVNRQELVDHILMGVSSPASSVIPKSLFEAKPLSPTTTQKATSNVGAILKRFPRIALIYPATPDWHKMAQALQQQWQESFGATIVLEGLEEQVFVSRLLGRDYQLALVSWVPDFADPISILDIFKTKSSGGNFVNWENDEYVKLLNASSFTSNFKKRTQMLKAAENILADSTPVIPLYERSLLYVKSERLKNLSISPTQLLDFEHAYID